MNTTTIKFDAFETLKNDDCQERIIEAKKALGDQVVILGHHYQNETVYRHADLTGDSLKLSKYVSSLEAKYIVFLGVHFMAEVSNILSRPEQITVLPDLSAGCSMADMANLTKVERTFRELSKVLDFNKSITPITYINSAADLKAFCGDHGGVVCTSTNAPTILDWAFKQKEKVLFFPDQNLGRWTGHKMNIPLEEMPIWDPDLPLGGLDIETIKKAKVLLWKGHCAVHQMFRTEHIDLFRKAHPDGKVISHPESPFEVCLNSDFVGSTEFILNTIKNSEENTKWLVGTELNLVNRLANEMKPEGKLVQFMSHVVCECSTMARIDPQHLAWTLENILNNNPVNIIKVPENESLSAKLALDRMLEIS
ncbi:quinolinate synthase NadA [Methylophilaceae bacterium]|jgi:quinolinate synthase|nr:quinolinate synthase NadA [Methylophilaceae bacterium]|tara:strand:+ start:1444 stop:2541 length:1098 start_codon:yes stop_codon:yes gene_type:complete